MFKKALKLAIRVHRGQTDKSGRPFIGHPTRVAARCKGLAKVVAILHDVVEDTDMTLDEIEERFGKRVKDGVDAMTRRDGEQYFAYIRRCIKHPLGKVVKRADIADNMDPSRSFPNSEGLMKRYEKTLEILDGGSK
jgi:(p)ppGpp synthase/HD superfamily hydrolase